LAAAPVPGRPSKLTHTQEKIVLRWLRESPTEHGFVTELWTGGRLAWLVERVLGVHFHPHYLNTWVRRRDVTPQKPQRRAREADPEAIAAWVGKDWPRIKRKARRRGACIAFIDESGLLMAPLVRRSLAPRGHPSVLLEKATHHEKVSVAASLWLAPGLDRLGLCFQTLPNDYFDNQYSALFLEALIQELGEQVIVVWDSGPMHKGGPIRQVLECWSDQLSLEPLPAHAPQLNPVEQVWTWLKYSRLCNFAPQDAAHLNAQVIAELRRVAQDQQLLKSLFLASDLPPPVALLT
jgi:hypothetical protein